MYKDTEKDLEKSLEKLSSFHPREKDEIWKAIENELFSSNKKKKRRKKRNWSILVATAALMMLLFGLQTDTGSALVDRVKSMFEPSKDVKQSIEGSEEETEMKLNEGKDAAYIIYIDEERYVMKKSGSGDIITTKEPLEARYPEVSMTITQIKDMGASDVFANLKKDIMADYPIIILEEQTLEPVQGYMLFAKKDGTDWDNELTKIYVFDNKAEGSFIIQQKYFAEAEEGHGARFDQMLKEFQIITE